ncbi:VWA domain-containing protein [Paracoccus sediminis]|uniref:Ca-activated chloride channel family protein n=1 Tax=Paracoccus sediminis TaxID=1214787 RepID=A0A238W0U1_9RHOB|nr:VWA domain-containing protein [Paracoccus sediminis]TBN51477.1 VWA domain-containing protein [Paracoccus sediminis]SNR40162.1 Ca-activated chloride channel family protein [Paracoccus sediminis]
MSLAWPWLLLLLPLPLVLRRLLPPLAVPRPALMVPAHLWQAARPTGGARVRGPWLAGLAWAALVVALAGPRIEIASDVIPASGRDIVMVIDLSGSMLKEDFVLDDRPVTRLDAVKRTASAFVAARRGDRIGLVIFGERAYFAAPLTFDVEAVARAIEEAQIGISGRGTAISDGLGLATKRLSRSDAPSRVIVLLSDGVDTSGTVPAVDAARLADGHGIRIHSIALGPEDLENQPRSRDAVDVATLRAVAAAAGGESFRVRDTADLQAVAQSLDALEPNPSDRPPMRLWQPLWVWPAAVAALCLALIAGGRRGWTG